MASLSIACLSRDTTGRLAAILHLYRPLAAEIVVAVDDRVLDEAAAALGNAADVIVGIPFSPPVERSLGWLHARCSGDWILRIDDDEVPSAALLDAIPSLIGQRAISHAFIPRRWLWQDVGSYLEAAPWSPDYQLRLVRNDPGLVWFPGVTHWPVEVLGGARYLSEPIYHLDLLDRDRETRERKASDYERKTPGRRVVGLPLNLAYYLPELRGEIPLAETPAADVAILRTVREAAPSGPATHAVERATAAELDAYDHGRPLADYDYAATLEVERDALHMHAGEVTAIDVTVTNRGSRTWAPHGLGGAPIFISYRWDGVGEGLRTPLPEIMPPGASTRLPVAVEVPTSPGAHALELDLVHENVRWFGAGARIDVDVTPYRRVGIHGEDEELLLRFAEALTELRPSLEPVLLVRDPGSTAARTGYAAAPSAHDAILREGSVETVRRAVAFADLPETVTDLVVAGRPGRRRERLVQWAVRRAARRRGIPLVHVEDAEGVEAAARSLPS
jgi:hypothetical protein